MNALVCSRCRVARGIKPIVCLVCKKKAMNYVNGAQICHDCAVAQNRCEICLIQMEVVKDNGKENSD